MRLNAIPLGIRIRGCFLLYAIGLAIFILIWPRTCPRGGLRSFGFWWVALALSVLGTLIARNEPITPMQYLLIACVSAACILTAWLCYLAFRKFTWTFAEVVYRDFCALPERERLLAAPRVQRR
jgi:hypothetical protein